MLRMKLLKYKWLSFFCLLAFISCSVPNIQQYGDAGKYPDIFPDYINVTIPCNMAPLNFRLKQSGTWELLRLEGNGLKIDVTSSDGKFLIPSHKWEKLLEKNKGESIKATVFVKEKEYWKRYNPFSVFISSDPIDPYLVYRLIEPGYELWNKMGIYQRNLENFNESAIYENKMTNYNCVNCHSFCMGNPKEMMFHLRGDYGGTMLVRNGKAEKLNTKTDSTISSLVYPCWHPSGKFIAFSVNKIDQGFYLNNKDRIEVFDSASDMVVYDLEKHEIFTSPLLFSKNVLETFPGFSPDGKTLYFCSAKSFPVPEKSDSMKYSLCSIPFYPETRKFGERTDTIFNAVTSGKSAAFPRVSPDGRFLLFTVAGYGSFPIWHKDADLCLYDLKAKKYIDVNNVNSPDVDSYHSWSSNSRWIVFSSRRVDGLYTRPFIAHIDKDGKTGRAFMLPQKDPDFYQALLKSYNIPELVKDEVSLNSYGISHQAKSTNEISLTFKRQK
jgi:hypothetical protein